MAMHPGYGMPLGMMHPHAIQMHRMQQAQAMQAQAIQMQQQQRDAMGHSMNPMMGGSPGHMAGNPGMAGSMHPGAGMGGAHPGSPSVQGNNSAMANAGGQNSPRNGPLGPNGQPIGHGRVSSLSESQRSGIGGMSKTGGLDSPSQRLQNLPANLSKREELLQHKEWYDPTWREINEFNVLDYFCNRQNPFYDSSNCINEILKSQRREGNQINVTHLCGFEYKLTYCQPPIMYIISKMENGKTLASYHIIAGKVRQAPDLASVITSRLTSTIHHLKNAYTSILDKSNYHPSVGYWWNHEQDVGKNKKLEREKEDDLLANNFQKDSTALILEGLFRKVQMNEEEINLKKKEEESQNEAQKQDQDQKVNDSQDNTPKSDEIQNQGSGDLGSDQNVTSNMAEINEQEVEMTDGSCVVKTESFENSTVETPEAKRRRLNN